MTLTTTEISSPGMTLNMGPQPSSTFTDRADCLHHIVP